MGSRAYIAKKDREAQLEIAEKKRKQDDIDSKRALAGNIIGSTIGAVGRIAGKGLGGKTIVKQPSYLLQDPSWYNKWLSQTLFSSFPTYRNYMNPISRLNKISHRMNGSVADTEDGSPYVISLQYCSRLGMARVNAGTNYLKFPANAMWVKVLNELAKVNSRSVNQDSDVLGLYTIATSEIIKLLGWIKTNIEITDVFNEEQGKLRDALLHSRSHDIPGVTNMFLNEKAQLKKVYNMYAHRFNEELPCIKDMAIYARRWWVSCAVIKDHAMNKAQYITFDPASFLVLNSDVDGLTPTLVSYFTSIGNLTQILDRMFERIATDVDMQTLIGNIRAAVNDRDFYKLPEDIGTDFAFIDADHHALHQFHNINTLPETIYKYLTVTDFTSFESVSSDGETLYQADSISSSGWPASTHAAFEIAVADTDLASTKTKTALDYYTDDVNSDLINESTRLHTLFSKGSYSSNGAAPYYYVSGSLNIQCEGTEFIYRASIYYWNNNSNAFSVDYVYSYMNVADYYATPDISDVVSTVNSFLSILQRVSRIDWMFKVTVAVPSNVAVDNSREVSGYRLWETSRTLEFAFEDFDKLNQMCLMSLYYSDPKSFQSKLVR